jgi:hypothetical protein
MSSLIPSRQICESRKYVFNKKNRPYSSTN